MIKFITVFCFCLTLAAPALAGKKTYKEGESTGRPTNKRERPSTDTALEETNTRKSKRSKAPNTRLSGFFLPAHQGIPHQSAERERAAPKRRKPKAKYTYTAKDAQPTYRGPSPLLRSLGVEGQGLFAANPIPSKTFVGWYEGKIFPSVRKLQEHIPAPHLRDHRDFSFFMDVTRNDGKYLYSIDGFQPEDGKELSNVVFVNHQPVALANCEFRFVYKEDAPFKIAPALFTKRKIEKSEELTTSYGAEYEKALQRKAPTYAQYVAKYDPDTLATEEDEDDEALSEPSEINPTQRLDLHPSLLRDVFSTLSDGTLPQSLYQIRNGLESKRKAHLNWIEEFEDDAATGQRKIELLESEIDSLTALNSVLDGVKQAGTKPKLFLRFKILQRITVFYWKIANLHHERLFLITESSKKTRNLIRLRHAALRNAFRTFVKAEAMNIPLTVAFAELGRSLREFPNITSEPTQRELTKTIEEFYELRYSIAQDFKTYADEILQEETNPLKSSEEIWDDRLLAIEHYHHAIALIINSEDADLNALTGDIFWTLAQAYSDNVFSDSRLVEHYAKQALDYYYLAIEKDPTQNLAGDIASSKKMLRRVTKERD